MIGMMQGRLTEPKGRGIQFFPFDNWEKEFYLAQKMGLDEIEFIFDYDNYQQNPLWELEGWNKIKAIVNETGIAVQTICFDYFMRRPFFKEQGDQREVRKKENEKIIKQILEAMYELDIKLLEIPLVDSSSLKSEDEKEELRLWLSNIIKTSDKKVKFALETDLPPENFLNYIESFNTTRLGANYDSGNSSGIGYNLYDEVTTLKDKIFNIHIKDRRFHGPTVELGTGSANFEALFKGLKEINYKNNFILQAARGIEGNECHNIVNQIKFVKDYIVKYGL